VAQPPAGVRASGRKTADPSTPRRRRGRQLAYAPLVAQPPAGVRDQARRRRRVYQIAPAPAATISAPSEMTAPIGAPVTGSALPALTPPPCVVMPGPGVGLALEPTELGLTPPGGTVSVLAVGVGFPDVDVPGAGVEGFVVGVVLGPVLGPVLP
jgi:hypothetical protein